MQGWPTDWLPSDLQIHADWVKRAWLKGRAEGKRELVEGLSP